MDVRLAHGCHVDSIEAADGKREDELDEAHDAEGEICHGFIEDGHFDFVCVLSGRYKRFSLLSLTVAVEFYPSLCRAGGWRLYVDLSRHNLWSYTKKKITRAAIQNKQLRIVQGVGRSYRTFRYSGNNLMLKESQCDRDFLATWRIL